MKPLLILLLICLIAKSHNVIIRNNAKVWPATLLSYSNSSCTFDINNQIIVGHNLTLNNLDSICLYYSAFWLEWIGPYLFTNVSYVSLEAKVKNHYLTYWFNEKNLQ